MMLVMTRRPRRTILLAVGAFLGLVALVATAVVAFACSQYATLFTTTTSVQPGQSVTVQGYHFENGVSGQFGPVLIYWSGGLLVDTVTPAADGSFVTSFAVPSSAQPGYYSITAQEWNRQHTVQEAGGYANAAMTIPGTPSSSSGGSGSSGGQGAGGAQTTQGGAQPQPSARPDAQASSALAVVAPEAAPATSQPAAQSAASGDVAPVVRGALGRHIVEPFPSTNTPAPPPSVRRFAGSTPEPDYTWLALLLALALPLAGLVPLRLLIIRLQQRRVRAASPRRPLEVTAFLRWAEMVVAKAADRHGARVHDDSDEQRSEPPPVEVGR